MHRVSILIFLLYASTFYGLCEDLYRDCLTGFSDISCFATPSGITITNTTTDAIIETPVVYEGGTELTCNIRLKDNLDAEKSRWKKRDDVCLNYGLVWNHQDSLNYCYAILRPTSRSNDDIISADAVHLKIAQLIDGNECNSVESSISLERSGIVQKGYNTIGLTLRDSELYVVAGHRTITSIAIASEELLPVLNTRIGYLVGIGGNVTIKSIEYEESTDDEGQYLSSYNTESIQTTISRSKDPMTGFWTYLDRKTDDNRFSLGGKYQIAIVPDDDASYSIIYISGAELYSEQWAPYMIKGKLTKTSFIGNYNLEWIDAKKRIMKDESFASLQDGILTLHFPLYGSIVRFYKTADIH